MAAPPRLILVVTGPTGVGKSQVAAALARLADIEVVSADSCQLYRYLNIGTAKPSLAEREAVPYHGLDLVLPTERFSAGRFGAEARVWIEDISARGRMPVVVGGTGFYLHALFEGLFEEPELDPERRTRLAAVLAGRDRATLERWALRLDAGFKGGGAQRAARVVEVALLTGQRLSALQLSAPAVGSGYEPWYAVLTLPRPILAERIAARTQRMLESGLVDEVQRVLAAGVPNDAPGLRTLGYGEVISMLEGRLQAADLSEAISAATRQYAKRQETWFRHQLIGPVVWLDASAEPEALANDVLARYRAAAT